MNEEQKILTNAVPRLLQWVSQQHNDLPWHGTKDAYRIWISEIMLQQTRIAAVLPYYERFLKAFPTVFALAEADEDLLMKHWEGLGYYSRARNLKKAARILVSDYGGALPSTVDELTALPGIGAYTAGAIASIGYGRAEPAVDGNVLRVVMRLLACDGDVLKEQTKRRVASLLRAVYPSGDDASHLTEALMLLGERVCLPSGDVRCDLCPLQDLCLAKRGEIVSLFPVRAPKRARRVECRTVLLLRTAEGTYAIRRRPPTGLLSSLYEFPNTDGHLTECEVRSFVRSLGLMPQATRSLGDAKHVFSHVEWHMIGYEVTVGDAHAASALSFFSVEDIRSDIAIPTAFRAYAMCMRA